jgi:hypothetical protein
MIVKLKYQDKAETSGFEGKILLGDATFGTLT